jgi:hypothetical protein
MTVLHIAELCTAIFIMSAKVIQSTVNNQENGSLVHGRFKMTVHFTLDPSCAAVVARKNIPEVYQPPDMVPCDFFLFS